MQQYFKIGKLAASIGLKGELILQHKLGKKTNLKGLQAIFIEDKKDSFLPYFVATAKAKSDTETIVKLEGVDVVEVARKLTPKEVWLSAEDFKSHTAKSSPISLLGYSLVNNNTNLGEIIEVIEQPHQMLCCIMYKGKEALIPIHEESLQKVDNKNRKVYVTLPLGLLEIYAD
jgi:16S rRNA processing protein RimM